MQGLLVAARYLTILPVPAGRRDTGGGLGEAAAWFPVIGLAIGVVVVAAERLTAWLFPSLLSALLTVTVWKIVSGGLHLDGLADCLDGLAGRDAAHRLQIMDDSRIGAFGVIGLVLFLLLEIAAVAELAAGSRWRALLGVPAIARATPPLLARLFPAARMEGHGRVFREGVRRSAVPLALGLALAVGIGLLGTSGVVAVGIACLAALGVGWFMTVRVGGITGDVLGAAVEVSELAALLTVAAWVHTAR